jgi:hypothetical protein
MSILSSSTQAAWLILLAQPGYWSLAEIHAEMARLHPRLVPVREFALLELCQEGRMRDRFSQGTGQRTYALTHDCIPLRKVTLGDLGLREKS